MLRRVAGAGLIAVVLVSPAWAQRGRGRTGPVVSPFGTLYDTRSPEWRASGGNPLVFQQLLEQKMMRQQQEQYLRAQKAAAKSQAGLKKSNNGKGSITTLPGQTPGIADSSFNPFIDPPPRTKKSGRSPLPSRPPSPPKRRRPATARPRARRPGRPCPIL